MVERHQLITLPDGRALGLSRFGDPAGAPVIYAHGFPASRLEAEVLDETAGRLGVAIIAPDRPGFGLSDFKPGRTILDWAEDVEHLANTLGFDRFALAGASGGCPFALACACRLPHRVSAVATIAWLGPATEKSLRERMGLVARIGFLFARRAPPLLRIGYGALGHAVARYPQLNFVLNRPAPPDRAMLARPKIRAILMNSVEEAFRQGVAGAVHELGLLANPWGFRLADLSVPMQIWHGQLDETVPPSMAEFMAGQVPGSQLRIIPGEGHVTLPVRHGSEILGPLVRAR